MMRRPGIWVANSSPSHPVKMLSWRPGALTAFFDYLGPNRALPYKQQHPEAVVVQARQKIQKTQGSATIVKALVAMHRNVIDMLRTPGETTQVLQQLLTGTLEKTI